MTPYFSCLRFSLVRPSLLNLTLFVAALLFGGRAVRAQGILYPRPDIRIQPFYVRDLRVNTAIHDAVAETTIVQTWVNTSSVEQEGTYLYPLPPGAAPTAFSMTVGERTLEPKILASGEARGIYEDIVRRRRDPALLEYVGRDLVKISVYPIPANGERKITMRYTQVLPSENGLHKYAYPLSTSRFGARPVGSVAVNLKITTATPIKNICSPTHALSIRKTDEHTATASYEGLGDASDRDLSVYFSTNGDDVGLSLLTYKGGDRDGYFVLLAAPRVVVPREKILPKQIVFVLDRTGSMAGPKIEQARKSLLFCLNSLHREDRFDVITFNESPDTLLPALAPASEENIGRARRFVENIEASGGTNIDEALKAALKLAQNDNGAQKMIVFLTDGLPTVGETNIAAILQHVRDLNKAADKTADSVQNGIVMPRAAASDAVLHTSDGSGTRLVAREAADVEDTSKRITRGHSAARIFCFGLGYDVNVPFLDRLGEQERGDSDFIKPQEDVEAKVSAFFAKVSSPILSGVRLAWDNADVYDVYPSQLPDLFKGSQLVITGRFRGERAGTVRLTGMANGAQETFRTPAPFASADSANGFVPRLWAQRKIGYLIDQLRLASVTASGGAAPAPNKELVDEIVRLSREYGIITEYTSFLVDDREQQHLGLSLGGGGFGGSAPPSLAETEKIRREVMGRAGQFGMSGEAATDQSGRAKAYNSSGQVASRYQSANGSVTTLNAPPAQPGLPNSLAAAKPSSGNFASARSGGSGAFADRDAAKNNGVMVQAVGDRAFYRQANALWQDQSYDAKKNALTKIQAFSDAHFALLRAVPALAAYSSVGDEIIIRVGSRAVQIGKDGKTTLTDAELRAFGH